MIFKTIEDEATASGLKITSIFHQAFDAIKSSGTFSFSSNFSATLQNDIACINNFKAAVASGTPPVDALQNCMYTASQAAIDYASSMEASKLSTDDFAASQNKAQIAMIAQNRSWTNCKSLITAYNDSVNLAGMSQQDFISAVGQSNAGLAKYLSGLNGAEASLSGYITSLVGAKVASIALQAATLALNAAITMGVSLIISGLVTAISEWYVSEEELASKVDEVTAAFNEQMDALRDTKDSLDDLAPKYAKLSQGVNDLGENVSLTAEEYLEYHDVTNQIADMFPTLIQGYDAEGNAILSVKGNVEELTAAYNELIKAANDAILIEGKNVFKDFKNSQKDFEESNFKGNEFTSDSKDALRNILNSSDLDAAIDQYAKTGTTAMVQIVQALKDAGFEQKDPGFLAFLFGAESESGHDFIKRCIQENKTVVSAIVGDFENQMAEETKQMSSLVQAYISNAFLSGDYSNITLSMQSVINSIIPKMDYEFFSQFDSLNELYNYLNSMLGTFNNLEDEQTFSAYFDLKTKFDNGE